MSNKKTITNLPTPSVGGLSLYLAQIKKFPMLDAEEEYMLAKNWRENGNLQSAHKLVTSHLRLVAKIAMGYRGYGLPVNELISEGNVGLMQAVKKFDPEKGFRLTTYAMWWIKAAMQEYILRSWSLVKIGTTAVQKKLFFNLRSAKNRIQAYEEGDLKQENLEKISNQLNVPEKEVINMNRRLSGGDPSLNATIKADGDQTGEWQDWLESDEPNQEESYSEKEEENLRKEMINESLQVLNDRELDIIQTRKLSDTPTTLEELSEKYNISRERIRQIEVRALEKVKEALEQSMNERNIIDI